MYVASLILGILSLLLSCVPIFGTILSVVALIISIVAVSKKEKEKSDKNLSIAGLVLSSVSVVISIFIIIFLLIFADFAVNAIERIGIELKDSDLGEYIGAEAKLLEKYAEVEFKNSDKMYTGYIDRITGEYVERGQGIEINEYYEQYLEINGYDVDVYVNKKGEPIIENDF